MNKFSEMMNKFSEIIFKAEEQLSILLDKFNIEESHGFDHAITVKNHAIKSIEYENGLGETQKLSIILASLLHDVDDRKFFNSENYDNARCVLNHCICEEDGIFWKCKEYIINTVIEMIDLVSCSKNGNKIINPLWKLIPRDCDRLEAIGNIGILRCYQYNKSIGSNLWNDDTPRACNIEELEQIATKERFQKYNGYSKSMVDHFYDKLLHIHTMSSGNKYVKDKANERKQQIIDFCLDFGRNGFVDESRFEKKLITE